MIYQTMFSFFEIESQWQTVLREELKKPYILHLASFIEEERASGKSIFPPQELVFNAFKQTPYDKVKVVIMGQDPYHGEGQAEGLCFSVPKGVSFPPSLKNIFKELVDDVKIKMPTQGSLVSWAQQGVLLLNATLTVAKNNPLSHYGKGWEKFTDAVIAKLCEKEEPVLFVLWGNSARKKVEHINHAKHPTLIAAHPSPFSAYNGFFGCRHFSKINAFLDSQNNKPIDWSLN